MAKNQCSDVVDKRSTFIFAVQYLKTDGDWQLNDCDRAPCRLPHLDYLGNSLRGHFWGLDLSGESKWDNVLRPTRLSRSLGLDLSVVLRVPRVG